MGFLGVGLPATVARLTGHPGGSFSLTSMIFGAQAGRQCDQSLPLNAFAPRVLKPLLGQKESVTTEL